MERFLNLFFCSFKSWIDLFFCSSDSWADSICAVCSCRVSACFLQGKHHLLHSPARQTCSIPYLSSAVFAR